MRQIKIAAAVCMLGMLALSMTACGSTDKNDPAMNDDGSGTSQTAEHFGYSQTVNTDETNGDTTADNIVGTPGNGGAMDIDGDGFIDNAAEDIGDAVDDIADDGANIINDVVTGAEDMLDDMTDGTDRSDKGNKKETSSSEKNS